MNGSPIVGHRARSCLALGAVFLSCQARPTPSTSTDVDLGPIQSFEGESAPSAWGMGSINDNSASNQHALEFYSTSTAQYDMEVIREASGIVVRARGDDCKGPPRMEVSVDGQRILATDVKSKNWTDYPVTVPLKLGMHRFVVTFPNDRYEPPDCDRNLYLDKITFLNLHPPNHGDLEAETLLFPGGSLLVDDPKASGHRALAFMSNGSAVGQTELAAPTQTLIVRARGDDCAGPPRLLVDVDGVERMAVDVPSKSWADYSADVPLPAGLHSISVAFPNDEYRPPNCDRNLYVDAIRFR